MKALFLDIDGVVQAHSDQNRFKHVDEFVELSKRLTLLKQITENSSPPIVSEKFSVIL
jgi:hypothetical protein